MKLSGPELVKSVIKIVGIASIAANHALCSAEVCAHRPTPKWLFTRHKRH